MASSQEYDTFYKEAMSFLPRLDLSIDEIRAHFETWLKTYPPSSQIRFESFSIGDLPALWAFAPNARRKRLLLFFFGGGFISGSIESHRNLIGRLSAVAGAAVCAIQYRLAPEYPFPAALDDALAAYRWLLHHPYARSRILFSGISAGGGLVLSLLLRLKMEKIAMPAGAICLCPWVDLTRHGESIQLNKGKDLLTPEYLAFSAEKYTAGHDVTDPFVSPLFGNLEGLPPLFIQVGMRDLLYSEVLQFAKKAQTERVSVTLDVWPHLVHAWPLFAPRFPEAQEALERIGIFVETLFRSSELFKQKNGRGGR